MWNETPIPSDLNYNGRLLSGRRPMYLSMGLAIAFLTTVTFRSPAVTMTALQTIIAVAAMRVFFPANFVWTEAIQMSFDAEGVTLTRPSGKVHAADWTMFDDVRLRPLSVFNDNALGVSAWKLTLMNARKPAISSFINAEADKVLFMFPLEIAFDATPEEARELHEALSAMVMQPA